MKKLILAAGLITIFNANAGVAIVDAGGVNTGAFDALDPNGQTAAVSNYFDILSDGITAGDVFVDSKSGLDGDFVLSNGDTAIIPGYGVSNDWKITFDYSLYGVLVDNPTYIPTPGGAGDSSFNDPLVGFIQGGFFNVNYVDIAGGGTTTQVLNFDIDSILAGVGFINLPGTADFSFCEPTCSSFVKDFFSTSSAVSIGGTLYTSYYDLWSNGEPTQVDATTSLFPSTQVGEAVLQASTSSMDSIMAVANPLGNDDTNFNSWLTSAYGSDISALQFDHYVRGPEILDPLINVREVPAPTPLAILSLGLLAFGISQRKNLKSNS